MQPPDLNDVIHTLEHPDPTWQQRAECRGLNVALFYPERGENDQTKHICAACPVRTNCLTEAIRNQDRHGHWGGLPEKPRRKIEKAVRTLRPDLVPPAPHGGGPNSDLVEVMRREATKTKAERTAEHKLRLVALRGAA